MVDKFLGRYTSVSLLGQGNMGQVWLARPPQAARPTRSYRQSGNPEGLVVAKIVHPAVAAQPRFRQMFEREIESMAKLRHPYIVQIIESSCDDPAGPCLIMEYVPGVTLEAFLQKQGRLSVGHAGLLLGYLCHALQAAHVQGIVHRDLKPTNVMVVGAGTHEESIRVMDFGLAQFAGKPHFTAERLAGKAQTITQGTPRYISPESLRGDEVDARADLYSLGVMLFEMLSGRLPFVYADVNELMRAHLRQPPPSLASLGVRNIPPAVQSVVNLCLSKFPVERPQSARELARQYSKAIGLDVWAAARAEGVPDPSKTQRQSKPQAVDDRNAIVHRLDAWMPESIAVVKLRGFLEDMGGKLKASEPGMLLIRLGERDGPRATIVESRSAKQPIEIELRMEKPDPRGNRLTITVLFRPFTDPILLQVPDWRNHCEILYKDLQSYLMAR
jgi:eukaryotic-like serine/threonine-protein kinase